MSARRSRSKREQLLQGARREIASCLFVVETVFLVSRRAINKMKRTSRLRRDDVKREEGMECAQWHERKDSVFAMKLLVVNQVGRQCRDVGVGEVVSK